MHCRWHLPLLSSLILASGSSAAESKHGKRLVILDNDWETVGFPVFLPVLASDMEVLGLTAVTADTWQPQGALHALATLELGNLSSCIPVYEGATWPLINTPERFTTWQENHGVLPFSGAFGVYNATREAEGHDPTGGNPNRIVKQAFYEGFPKGTPNKSMTAAEFMVQSVKKYPGQVSIFAAGSLTNVALAIRIDPDFPLFAKELVIMGGFVDFGLRGVIDPIQAGFYEDINFKIDPEAAKIALTANFSSITIGGNVANQVISSPEFLEEVDQVKNPYSDLFLQVYHKTFPFWDETTALIMVDPTLSINQTEVYIDVDTAYDSPFYGNLVVYNKQYAPAHAGKAIYVNEVNATEVKKRIKSALQYPKACKDLNYGHH
ncbi:hypothetical protein PT974_04829 [Cladobotryum mycophilum]|uniref:Inosine/uridine-preferring nucleoside hydrolase domain-containing protein n=1 Tax=Cladobotryum mycophilum TaxID=491253 RepID=A0ABR0SRK5_9HYPO